MDNIVARKLDEEIAYINGYTDALEEIKEKRRKKQAQQKKKSERRAKAAAGIIYGTIIFVLSGIAGVLDKDCTFFVFVAMIEGLIVWDICKTYAKRIRRSRKHGNERQGNKRQIRA